MICSKPEARINVKGQNNYILCSSVRNVLHPFIKPAPVWKHLLEVFTFPLDRVLDPFAGVGSMLKTAYELERNPLGFEILEDVYARGDTFFSEEL
jgi:DNA modification methylase